MRRIHTIQQHEIKLREPYGGTWIDYLINVKLDEDGHIVEVTVTDPDGMEHRTKDVQ